ncbi:MAG: alpha-L-fucosidase [Bacteroidales bacterium]|nr:alpha-L-fucosidase [Bacteroidales bacterium]
MTKKIKKTSQKASRSGVTNSVTIQRHVILACILILSACTNSPTILPQGGGGEANPNLTTNIAALEEWQDMRFGMFVHWGPVALKGTEIGWSRGREIPFSTYDSLYMQFNPVNFDASEWISIAKEAGMKYFVITAKHHDGFSLYDSEFTDYDIMNTPIKRDLMKEMQLACEEQDIMFSTYYSVLDWYHPHYTTRYRNEPRPVEDSNMDIYKQFLFDQVGELITKYNTNLLWFDGQWEASWTHEMGMELYQYCRELKDDLLINNRVDKGFKGMAGMTDSIAKYAGDYGTPEQRIGEFNNDYPWESCITICNQWAWKPDDKLKSTKECIHTLIKTIGGDGNLLLNVGPMPDGRIEPRQVEVLKEIGNWLKVNDEAVYGTRGGPYMPGDEVACTYKGKSFFLHIMNNSSEIVIPSLEGVKVKNVTLIRDADRDARRNDQRHDGVTLEEVKGKWIITLPEQLPSSIANVVEVRTNTLLSEIEPVTL